MSKKRNILLSGPFKLASALSFIGLLLSYLAPFIHPSSIPALPFFGLSYPIFLGLTIFWLLFWGFLRSKWAIYSLLVLLIGGKLHFRNFALSNAASSNSEPVLKVLTYNVRLFDLFNPDFEEALKSRNEIFAYIRNEQPDVLCLQEFYRQDKPTRFEIMDSLNALLQTKDYHERSAHKRATRENYGIALFSKYPMIARGDVMFESQGVQDFNYCIFADIVDIHFVLAGLKQPPSRHVVPYRICYLPKSKTAERPPRLTTKHPCPNLLSQILAATAYDKIQNDLI